MSFEQHTIDDVLILELLSRFDEGVAAEFVQTISERAVQGGRKFAVGLPVERPFSDEEVGIVLLAAQKASREGAELVVFTPEPRFYQMLMTSTPGELLRVFRSVEDVLAYFRGDSAEEWELVDRLVESERGEHARQRWVIGCLAIAVLGVALVIWWSNR